MVRDSMPLEYCQKDTHCGYNPKTQRCVKHTKNEEFRDSILCNCNPKTGMCVKKRPTFNACKRDQIIFQGTALQSRCPKKCLLKGLGKTTLAYLEQNFSLPRRWDMNYGVLDRGECVAVNRYGVIYEVRYYNNRILVNFGDYEATVIPDK